MMEYIDRSESVITGNKSLEPLYSLANFPVFIGATSAPRTEDMFADMQWSICKESGVIQLNQVLPLEIVYSSFHSEAVGSVWAEHRACFAGFISKYAGESILEIGGSNGALAQGYIERNPNKHWTIVEPSPNFAGNERIKVIKGFFNKDFLLPSVDTIVHSHVLEHIYNPREFLKDVSDFLPSGNFQIFSIPNLKKYLENKFVNTINFEHTFLLTEELADYLLSLYGFEIVEKEYFGLHSIFYATRKSSRTTPLKLPNRYCEYKRLYEDFIAFYQDEVKRLNTLIADFNGAIYLFGAHIFSQFLIYMGLDSGRIAAILDNSSAKNGKRLYGTDKMIVSPSIIGAGGGAGYCHNCQGGAVSRRGA